jgi:hypothetical protein
MRGQLIYAVVSSRAVAASPPTATALWSPGEEMPDAYRCEDAATSLQGRWRE